MAISELKQYFELGAGAIFFIIAIILLIKITIIKKDVNKNGKIDKEELTDADTQFIKEMLKESIITIATGMKNLNNINGNSAYNMLLKEVKSSKKIFEEIEKKETNNNEKNS